MNIEEWCAANQLNAGEWAKGMKTVHVGMLLEFMKGKVLVDAAAIKFASEEIELSVASGNFISTAYPKPNSPRQNERIERLEACLSVLRKALQPASSEAGSTTTESSNG
jgi:hypothetical protein